MPPAEPARETAPRTSERRLSARAVFGLALVGALVIGVGVGLLVHRNPAPAAATAGAVGASDPNQQGAGTQDSDGPGPGGRGPGGGLAGEQHIEGTLTAKTASTITVKSASGTAAYTVDNSTEILRNGQTAALAAVQIGDPVVVHVYPSGGQMLVERLLAGTSASDGAQLGPRGGPDDGPGAGARGPGNGTTTQ
jgi:hypothetical protein